MKWILIEMVDVSTPHYSIVPSTRMLKPRHLLEDKITRFRSKDGTVLRTAKILRISSNKQNLKTQKAELERDANYIRNMFYMCMQTFNATRDGEGSFQRSQSSLSRRQSRPSTSRGSSGTPRIVSESGSDSDEPMPSGSSRTNERLQMEYFNRMKLAMAPRIPVETRTIGTQTEEYTMEMVRYIFEIEDKVKELLETYNKQMAQVRRALTRRGLSLEFLIREEHEEGEDEYDEDDDLEDHDYEYEEDQEEEQEHQVEEKPEAKQDEVAADRNERPNTHNDESKSGASGNVNVKMEQAMKAAPQSPMNIGESNLKEDNDMIAIGNGHVKIPARLMKDIVWDHYSIATRQLLQAAFPRKILATHSLSGRPSPAFSNKPPKNKLDPKMVDDIVTTVSQRCGVQPNIIRGIITTKCTDEAKLYRNRLKSQGTSGNQSTVNLEDQENKSPSPSGAAPYEYQKRVYGNQPGTS